MKLRLAPTEFFGVSIVQRRSFFVWCNVLDWALSPMYVDSGIELSEVEEYLGGKK